MLRTLSLMSRPRLVAVARTPRLHFRHPSASVSPASATTCRDSPREIHSYINHPHHISDGMIRRYERDGFVVIDDMLTREQIEVWREVIDAAVLERGNDWTMPNPGQADTTNLDFDFYLNVFTQRVNLFRSNPEARKLLLSAGRTIGKLACILEGIPRIRLWHDQALYKEPWANATSWHVDNPFWSFSSTHAISCWIPLDDATVNNGCLYFIPGSHKVMEAQEDPFKEIKIGTNMRDVFDAVPDLRGMSAVPVPMRKGSISFHNGLTVHGAGPNMTPYRRRAMTFAMMPDGSVFNGKQNILTDKQMKELSVGDPLSDDEHNPVLYTCSPPFKSRHSLSHHHHSKH